MKSLFVIILSFFSLLSIAQETIYDINRHNLYLSNNAYYGNQVVDMNLDHSLEYYNSDRMYNATNLNIDLNLLPKLNAGIDIQYQNFNGTNSISEFDIYLKHLFNIGSDLRIILAGNIGYIRNNISDQDLPIRYSFNNDANNSLAIKNNLFNLGIASTVVHEYYTLGISLNHINQANIPNKDNKLPIKYDVFLRNKFFVKKLFTTLSYAYQESYMIDNWALDNYYDFLYYLGINANYEFSGFFNFGLGYKDLSNVNNIYSAQLGTTIGNLNINYSASVLQDISNNKYAQFHQIGLNYILRNSGLPVYRLGGTVLYL